MRGDSDDCRLTTNDHRQTIGRAARDATRRRLDSARSGSIVGSRLARRASRSAPCADRGPPRAGRWVKVAGRQSRVEGRLDLSVAQRREDDWGGSIDQGVSRRELQGGTFHLFFCVRVSSRKGVVVCSCGASGGAGLFGIRMIGEGSDRRPSVVDRSQAEYMPRPAAEDDCRLEADVS